MQSKSSTLFRIRRVRFPHPRSQFAHPLHAGFTRGRPPPPPRPPPLTTYRLSDGRAEAAAAGCEGGRGRRSGGGPGGVPASEVGDTPPRRGRTHLLLRSGLAALALSSSSLAFFKRGFFSQKLRKESDRPTERPIAEGRFAFVPSFADSFERRQPSDQDRERTTQGKDKRDKSPSLGNYSL